MAGPCAGVLIRGRWTSGDVDEFHAWLSQTLIQEHGDWWVLRDPRRLGMAATARTGPMLVSPGDTDCDDADEAAVLKRLLGVSPATTVTLDAAVNGGDDHRFLAGLAAATARRYGGLVDLDGLLPVPPPEGTSATPGPDHGDRRREDASRAVIAGLAGRSYEVPYRTVGDGIAFRHVVDADLLLSWLGHPSFRMVK